MPDLRCHEDVTRNGESQPCDKPAVGWRYDTEGDHHYPVCGYHCHGDMVPLPAQPDLAVVAKAIREAGEAHTRTVYYKGSNGDLRFVCACGHETLEQADVLPHLDDAMARAAADAMGVG